MFGATQEYVDTKWKPYFQSQMDYLKIPTTKDTSAFLNESINILNNKSYDEAVAYVKSLTPKQILVEKTSTNTILYAIGGGLLLAAIFLLRKS